MAVGNGMKPFAHWPEYFRLHGRREPAGQRDTPFSFGWGHAALPPWEVKALYPYYGGVFARSMRSRQIVGGDTVVKGQGALYDFGWVAEEEGAVVVDVGGGLGQLVKDLLKGVDGLSAGQCVLQDREEVIQEAREGEGLEGVVMMEHDFHEEQPVKGEFTILVLARVALECIVADLFQAHWSISSGGSCSTTRTAWPPASCAGWPRPCRPTTPRHGSSSWRSGCWTRRRRRTALSTWSC